MYFPLVDLLRFFAAASVMCFHYFSGNTGSLYEPLNTFINYGYLGVPLFFSISGFVIYFSLKKSLKEYALGRFLRLYPLFWFICTLTFILTLLFPNGNPVSLTVFLKNLLIVNNGDVSKMVDGSYWTLTMEILFYTYIALFVYWFSLKRVEWFYVIWLLVSFLSFYFGLHGGLIFKILLVRFAPYFIFGGVLGLSIENWGKTNYLIKIRYLTWLILSAILPVYISHVLNLQPLLVTNSFGIYNFQSLVRVELIFIFLPIAVYFSKFITQTFIIKLSKIAGGITYPLYLLHDKIGRMFIGYYSQLGDLLLLSILMVVFMLIFSYLISIYEFKLRRKIYMYLNSKIIL